MNFSDLGQYSSKQSMNQAVKTVSFSLLDHILQQQLEKEYLLLMQFPKPSKHKKNLSS